MIELLAKRPLNINPFTVRQPIMAIVSISHRISGIIVFLLIPILLWSLSLSLASPEGLAQTKDHWQNPLLKMLSWILVAGLIFHLIAGIRHLLMDIHIGDSLQGGRTGAVIVITATIIVFIATFLLWGLI